MWKHTIVYSIPQQCLLRDYLQVSFRKKVRELGLQPVNFKQSLTLHLCWRENVKSLRLAHNFLYYHVLSMLYSNPCPQLRIFCSRIRSICFIYLLISQATRRDRTGSTNLRRGPSKHGFSVPRPRSQRKLGSQKGSLRHLPPPSTHFQCKTTDGQWHFGRWWQRKTSWW